MPDNDQDGVITKFSTEKKKTIASAKAQKHIEDIAIRRKEMLARTSLTPYQVACLKDIPIQTIRRAWFTLSHLLLEPGAMIAVMGCRDGSFAYAMAVLNPDFHIIGLDADRAQITRAKKMWQLTNLEFVVSKVSKPSFPNNSLDAVVNSFTLHEIYSRQGFNDAHVHEMLENHFSLLKTGGLIFLRDYIHPPPGEYVMMEFPDIESMGENPEELSEADLLVLFSEQARNVDSEGRGFFMEELEPYYQNTRLFRLPYKWAYEFMLRKDNRTEWEEELAKEYTFMTAREIRKTLRRHQARLVYSAPYWDPSTISKKYEGHFRLYDDEGMILGYPATSHIFLARKVGDGDSISLQERRPSPEPTQHLRFQSMRNTATGEIMDLVARDTEIVEFLPYRISDNGRLHIFLHEGMPRAITNAVPRSGKNIDGKRWSGHMVEAVGVDREILSEYDEIWSAESTHDFSLKHLGLRPAANSVMEQGPEFYPNPAMIDERIETNFINVQKSRRSLTPRWVSQITKSFSDAGKIREYDAQHVLNAISVGLIPSARLERQILALFSMLGIAADNWAETPLYLEEADVPKSSFDDLLKVLKDDKKYFSNSKDSAGSIRSLHSYFVDEGYENGTIRGLAARDIEFIIQENKTVNTAVVLPLVKDMSGEVLAGYIQDFLPVPERMGKNSKTIRAPSFNLPPEVKDMNAAKAFVAEQFSVDFDRVLSLGESYYIHNGITPQRIFPFAVTSNIHGTKPPGGTYTEYAPIRWLWILVWHLFEESYATILKRAMERMHVDIDMGIDKRIGLNTGQEHARWSTPPPIGMPIPSSPEEHDLIASEYRGSPSTDVSEKDSAPIAKKPNTPKGPQSAEDNIRVFGKKGRAERNAEIELEYGGGGSGDSSSGDGSGSGGLEKATNETQENKQTQQQKKTTSSVRRFENIDYSDIDGDKPKEEKEKEKELDGRKAPVVSILRPPPTRKQNQGATTQPALTPDGLVDDFEDLDYDDELEYEDELDRDHEPEDEDRPTPER